MIRGPIVLAWRQLVHEPMKLATAVSGVMAAVMLMWVQLGILAALYASVTKVHRHLSADLVAISPLSENLGKMRPFSTRVLYRMLGDAEVAEVGEMLVGPVDWRNPATGEQRQIVVYGFDPDEGWLDLPGIAEHAVDLREPDTLLFDRNSKNVFGPVVGPIERGERLEVEANHRRVRAVGLTAIASSFGQDGSVVASRTNFLRWHPDHPSGLAHLGLARLRPGASAMAVRDRLNAAFGPDVVVMTPPEFVEFELRFWRTNAPVGFVFTMGTVIGFLIGFIVVYQILYTDVTNNLPRFATMKAMGFTDGYLLRVVLAQALLLACCGYVPGSLLAIGFYKVVQAGTSIPVEPTWGHTGLLLGLTCLMCFLSGAMATRRLRAADPADVF